MSERHYSLLLLLLLVCVTACMQAQSCFDMTTLTESVRFSNRDLGLQSVKVDNITGKKHYSYGWNKSESPAGHGKGGHDRG